MELPAYVQKAFELGLIEVNEGKICGVNTSVVSTIAGTARLVEKLQPTTIVDKDDTTDQEAIVLCRVLTGPSGIARELWSQLRTAFGMGHGQPLPTDLWSNPAFIAIGKEIDLTFIGERTGKTISRDSLITGYEVIAKRDQSVSFSEFCTAITELSSPETMKAYGNEISEWATALDILKQKRVLSLYKETLYLASQSLKTDPKLDKALEFIHSRTLEGIGMLSGSVGSQGHVIELSEAICGEPGNGRLNWADYIMNSNDHDRPVSTGVSAFDIDMDGGVAPPRPNMPRAGRLLVLGARTGVGKCQGRDTPVIMADGSVKAIQDVLEDDLVLGPDGETRRVYGLARGRSEMYRIDQFNGDCYIVNDCHVLSLRVAGEKHEQTILGKKWRSGDVVNIEIGEYLKLSEKEKNSLKGWKSREVKFHGAPEYDCPVSPYIAGLYLANDNHDSSTPLLDWFRQCNLSDNEKYIPESLKRATIEQRLEVLAGIIDSSGTMVDNCFNIKLQTKRFADDIAFVARSLGLLVTISQGTKDDELPKDSKVYYYLYISGNTSKVPTRIQFNKCAACEQVENKLDTDITVTPIGIDNYYGFALDGVDNLYLMGDFTVTHNTGIGVHVAASLAKGGLSVGFLSAELEFRSIEARIIANLSKSIVSPYHWKRVGEDEVGYVTVGELEIPGATRAQAKIARSVAAVAQKLQEEGGKILIEAPWGACVDTCINIMRSMKAKEPELRAIVLDHFHALSRHKGGSASNPSSMLEDRAYKLMTAAKELDIDLFVLAQLNRIGMDPGHNPEPQLNEIRGTDALAHVSHATWLVRKIKTEGNQSNRDLEIWHSKVRGRQAVWRETRNVLESVNGFIDKSVIRMHYETSSVEDDTTQSLVKELDLKQGLKL
jgi:replicative DNA helicase